MNNYWFILAISALLSACSIEDRARLSCHIENATLGAIANTRTYSYSGQVNGRPYSSSITTHTRPGDPGYIGFSDDPCIARTIRQMQGN